MQFLLDPLGPTATAAARAFYDGGASPSIAVRRGLSRSGNMSYSWTLPATGIIQDAVD